MFKKLKEKITEEVKSSPQRFQQLTQSVSDKLSNTVTDDNFFSIGDDDANSSHDASGFSSVSLSSPTASRQRKNSASSVASDASFLPRYDSTPSAYHIQSDLDASASELEDNASSASQLGHLSKEQIYSAFRKSQLRYHKYRGRYTDLAKHYREFEHENAKMKAVLVETQDKAIRRVAELKEQCSLEQRAKAHLEAALRDEIDEKQLKIASLAQKIELMGPPDAESDAKLQEAKANLIVFQAKEAEHRNRIAALEKELHLYAEREKEGNLALAQHKMELHNEILTKEAELASLRHENDALKQSLHNYETKPTNFQLQNKNLIEKVEALTLKCNHYENELVKFEQARIENEKLKTNLEISEKEIDKVRNETKAVLINIESNIRRELEAEFSRKTDEMRLEFKNKMADDADAKLNEIDLVNENKTLSNQLDDIKRLLEAKQMKYDELETFHLGLIEEGADLRRKLADLGKKNDEKVVLSEAIESRVRDVNDELKRDFDVKLAAKNEEIAKLELKLKENQENYQLEARTMQQKLNRLGEQMKQVSGSENDEKLRLCEEISGLKARIEENETLLRQKSEHLHGIEMKFKSELDKQVKINQEEKVRLKDEVFGLENKLKNVEAQLLMKNGAFCNLEAELKEIQEKNDLSRNEENVRLCQQILGLETQLNDLKIEKNDYINKEIQFKGKLEQQNGEKVKFGEEISALQAKIVQLKDNLSKTEAENHQMKEKQKEYEVKIKEIIQNNTRKLDEEKVRLNQTISGLQKKLDQSESILGKKHEDMAILERNYQEKVEEWNNFSKNYEKVRLNEEISLIRTKLDQTENDLIKKQEEIDRLEEKYQLEIGELKERHLKSENDEKLSLNQEISSLQAKLEQIQDVLHKNNEKFSTLEEKYREKVEEVNNLSRNDEKVRLNEEISSIGAKLEQTENDLLKKQEEINILNEEYQIEIKELKQTVLESENDTISRFNHEILSLQAKLAQTEDALHKNNEELSILEQKYQEKEEETLNIKETVKLNELKLSEKEEEIKDLHRKLSEKQNEIEKLVEKFEISSRTENEEKLRLGNEIAALTRKLVELEGIINKKLEEINKIERQSSEEIAEKQQKIEELLAKLQFSAQISDEKLLNLKTEHQKSIDEIAAKHQHENAEIVKKIHQKNDAFIEIMNQLPEMNIKSPQNNKNLSNFVEKMKYLDEIAHLEVHNLKKIVASVELLQTENVRLETEISELKTKLHELENELLRLGEEIESIETEKAKQRDKMAEMEGRNVQISTDNKFLTDENTNLVSENEELKLRNQNGDQGRIEQQLVEMERHVNELVHEKQLLQDEIVELKTSPINVTSSSKLENLDIVKMEAKLGENERLAQEIDILRDKLTQYKSLDLTNKCSIEFNENELDKFRKQNEKLNTKLDETLVTLNHCTELSSSTEVEYLRNVLYNYMLGKESVVLARVIAAVCKFDAQQTETVLAKEQQKQTLLGHLGIL